MTSRAFFDRVSRLRTMLLAALGVVALLVLALPPRPAAAADHLWGVDSVDHLDQGFVNSVAKSWGGSPDFVGRYIGSGLAKDLKPDEVTYAKSKGIAIMPIWFNFCSTEDSHAWGAGQAQDAIAAARAIGVAPGTAIYIDLEPVGSTCAEPAHLTHLIEGWADGFAASDYKPGFYGHTTPSDPFNSDYCAAARIDPFVADAYEYSYYHVYNGVDSRYAKPGPAFDPVPPSCSSHTVAWQYWQPGPITPPVNADLDESLPNAPLWHPGGGQPTPPPPPPTTRPTPPPTAPPTAQPTATPTAKPTSAPTSKPTASPTPTSPGWPNTGVEPTS